MARDGRVGPEEQSTPQTLSKPEAHLTCAKAMGIKLLPLIVAETIDKLSRFQLFFQTSCDIKHRFGFTSNSDATPQLQRTSATPILSVLRSTTWSLRDIRRYLISYSLVWYSLLARSSRYSP